MREQPSELARGLSRAFNFGSRPMKCPVCETVVETYTMTHTDTHKGGLWYKTKTTYCKECDADLNHETLDSGRK